MQYKITYIENLKKCIILLAWQSQTDFENTRDKISKFHKQYFAKPMASSELINNNDFA